jgi:hypothetical protein
MLTNNQGLLNRISTSLLYPQPFPNLTLLSDISQSLLTFARKPILKHVKGHQDQHTAYSNLPLDARMNADAEAGAYQCMHPARRPLIPRLPSNSVQLHINGNVICTLLKQRICEAATVPAYLAYVAKRFKWDQNVALTVDWQAYTQTIGLNSATIFSQPLAGPTCMAP